MSKAVTISSLVRQAAKSEVEFVSTVVSVFTEEPVDRIADFFDRLNIPRSVEGEALLEPIPEPDPVCLKVTTYEDEHAISSGMQKYMDRHIKKLKWHAQRPSIEGSRNVMLLMRQAMYVTELRLGRLYHLMQSKDELTAEEWAIARELMNRGYLAFRHFLAIFGGTWIDAATATLDRAELEELIDGFYTLVDGTVRRLEEHRERIENRRQELTVLPRGYDPVKPPIYFGGDLMARGPWKQFWNVVEDRAHHFREALA
ncbi:MAG: hypothetical protein H6733_02160 [Alphaproteobacteria bacterium]|nr:hypothetical protein [Alphaproteobacteria bacterium]